jgi:transposase
MGRDQGNAAGTGRFRSRDSGGQPPLRRRGTLSFRTGVPWRDLPEALGDWNNTHRRFSRWAARGVWERLLTVLAADADNEYAMIDATCARISTAPVRKKLTKTKRLAEARAV